MFQRNVKHRETIEKRIKRLKSERRPSYPKDHMKRREVEEVQKKAFQDKLNAKSNERALKLKKSLLANQTNRVFVPQTDSSFKWIKD